MSHARQRTRAHDFCARSRNGQTRAAADRCRRQPRRSAVLGRALRARARRWHTGGLRIHREDAEVRGSTSRSFADRFACCTTGCCGLARPSQSFVGRCSLAAGCSRPARTSSQRVRAADRVVAEPGVGAGTLAPPRRPLDCAAGMLEDAGGSRVRVSRHASRTRARGVRSCSTGATRRCDGEKRS